MIIWISQNSLDKFQLLGIYLVLTGSLFILNVNDLGKKILPISEPLIIPGLIILIGVVMFTIAFCGCCGACKFNSCLLILVKYNHWQELVDI